VRVRSLPNDKCPEKEDRLPQLALIVPVLENKERDERITEEYQLLMRPGNDIRVFALKEGPKSLQCASDVVAAGPGILRAIAEAEQAGVQACMIDCFGDPAIEAAREVAIVPIVAAGQSGMCLAATLGQSFSVVTVLPETKPHIWNRACAYGFTSKLASIRDIDMPVLQLREEREIVQKRLLEESELAIQNDGAHVIVLGCTGMQGMATSLQQGLKDASLEVPVIDPLHAMIKHAEGLLDMGLSYSRITYRVPPSQ